MKFISQMPLARERSRFHFAAVLLAAWPQLASGAAKIAKWSAPGTNYRGPPFHQAIPICDSITYRLRKPHITRRLLTLRPVLSRSPCGLPDADGGSPRSTAAGLRRRAALQAHQCWPRRGRNSANERQPPFHPPALKFGAFAEAATTRSSAATTSATLAPPLPPALARVAGCQPAGPAVRDSRPFGGARRWLRQRSACCAPSRPISCGVDGVGAPRARRRRRRAPPGWGCWVVASPERPGGARWRALAPAARARRAGTTGTAGYRA